MVLEGNHLHIKAHLAFFADAFSWKEIVHFDHSLLKVSNDDSMVFKIGHQLI